MVYPKLREGWMAFVAQGWKEEPSKRGGRWYILSSQSWNHQSNATLCLPCRPVAEFQLWFGSQQQFFILLLLFFKRLQVQLDNFAFCIRTYFFIFPLLWWAAVLLYLVNMGNLVYFLFPNFNIFYELSQVWGELVLSTYN